MISALPAVPPPILPTHPDALVCVVDDEESVRNCLERLLRSAHFNVETYPSAPAYLARRMHAGPVCLVLDVNMPEMDGFGLLTGIGRPQRGDRVPHRPWRCADVRQGIEGRRRRFPAQAGGRRSLVSLRPTGARPGAAGTAGTMPNRKRPARSCGHSPPAKPRSCGG